MQLTLVDGGVAIVTLLSGYLAYVRGFTREVLAIGGWILAAAVAAVLTPVVEPLVREAPVIGGFLASSCILSVITAFVLVMALGLLILAVFTPIFSAIILDSVLGPVDRVLGFVFGVARGVLLVVVAYLIYQQVVGPPEEWPPYADAESRPVIEEVAGALSAAMPSELPPWISERIDAMMAPCAGSIPDGQTET
jgi:membrane protein required for colicin V production